MTKEEERKAVRIIDRATIATLVTLALSKGYGISVDYGEDAFELKNSHNKADILEIVHACDEEYLHFHDEKGKRFGWVRFIYGECGWDVVCDHTTDKRTAEMIDTGPLKAICDELANNGLTIYREVLLNHVSADDMKFAIAPRT